MTDKKPSAVLAATFTADSLKDDLTFLFGKAALEQEIVIAPYNQMFQELLSIDSSFLGNQTGLNIALIRLEDFVRDVAVETDKVLEDVSVELKDALATYARQAKAPTIIVVFDPSSNATQSWPALAGLTKELALFAQSIPNLSVMNSTDIDGLSEGDKFDQLTDELAHIPFTEEYFSAIALAITRRARALLKPPHKVLVLDCDNTIWAGVVGEDGVDGVTISRSAAAVQQFASRLHQQGILICLVSKNADNDVLAVFQNRSDMILKLEQIVARRVNWLPKPQNISSLAAALNLGLDAFVFIDDNPVECEQMRVELPQVSTFQLPTNDEEAISFLQNLWVFDKTSITEEDKRRTEMYRENAAREEFASAATSITDFIDSLKVITEIAPPKEQDWPRLAQLTQRTNQFNFNTLRQTENQLRTRARNGEAVLCVRVKDRFGDYGLVGCVLVNLTKGCFVDLFLLSCRVLGRGVEHSVLRHLGTLAGNAGSTTVEISLIPSDRNEPARAFIDSVAAEFRENREDAYVYRIPTAFARQIAHRPGQDPDAVIAASRSSESAQKAGVRPSGHRPAYDELAHSLTSGRAVRLAMRKATEKRRDLRSAAAPASTATESRLLEQWRAILGISDIGIDDDFAASGGTSLMAARLFAGIDREFHIKLPLTTILDAPTVRLLSQRIEGNSLFTSDVVALRPGLGRNLFMIHDGEGETLLYMNLARRLPTNIAVFGLQPKTAPQIPMAHFRIEDLASWYIDRMMTIQSSGPFFVGGMCAGGVIAYEICRQLRRRGQDVGLLLLLDAAAPQAPKRFGRVARGRFGRLSSAFAGQTDESTARRLIARARLLGSKGLNVLRWEARNYYGRRLTSVKFAILRTVLKRGWRWPSFLPQLTVREIYESCERTFFPTGCVQLPVALCVATEGEGADTPYRDMYADDTLGWKTLIQGVEIVEVRGGHASMLQEPFVESLAGHVCARLTPDNNRRGAVATEIQLKENA